MSYTDKIKCPNCHKEFEVEVEIEGDDGKRDLCPIIIPKPNEETHWDRLELERRLGK